MKTYILLLSSFLFSTALFSQERDLTFYLSQSKINSPLLVDYKNQINSLSIDQQLLKASLGLQIAANSELFYAPVINGYGFDDILTNGQHVIALINVKKEIVRKGRINTQLKSSTLNQEGLINQIKLSEETIEKNIVEQYILTYTDQEQLKLSEEIIELLLTEDVLLKKMTQSSVFKQTDYLAFKVNLQQQLLTKKQLEIQYKNNFATLNYLSGIIDTSKYEITKPEIVPKIPRLFNESYYFESFRIDSLKNKNDRDLINLNYKPKISVFTEAGYQSSLTIHPYRNTGWSAGLNLSIPIYDGNQRKMLIAQNNLKEKSREAYLQSSGRQYQQITLQLKQLINQYDTLITDSKKQLEFSETLVKANALQLKTGEVRMTDYILSINNYLDLRSSAILNQSNRLILINQLNSILLK